MTRTRKLYITDKLLERKRACTSVRDQINEILGTRKRRVLVSYITVLAIESTLHRIGWAVDHLLSPKQERRYWEVMTTLEESIAKAKAQGATDYRTRSELRASAFVDAYYSPKA